MGEQDTVYVSGLAKNVTEEDLAERFGSIGILKLDKKTREKKIWIYKDKATGEPKGDALVTYDDPAAAAAAVNWFNGSELKGQKITVELARKKDPPPAASFHRGRGGRGGFGGRDRGGGHEEGEGGDFGGGGDRGGFGGGRGGGGSGRGGFAGREGDWLCASCGNTNFARRFSCNRCNAPKPEGGGSGGGGGTGGGGSDFRGPPRGGGPPNSAGDWPCASCGNVNFARRNSCNRCQASRPDAPAGGGGGDRGYSGGGGSGSGGGVGDRGYSGGGSGGSGYGGGSSDRHDERRDRSPSRDDGRRDERRDDRDRDRSDRRDDRGGRDDYRRDDRDRRY